MKWYYDFQSYFFNPIKCKYDDFFSSGVLIVNGMNYLHRYTKISALNTPNQTPIRNKKPIA